MLGRLLRSLVGKTPDVSAEALFQRGMALSSRQRWDESLEALRQAVEAAPGNAGYHIALGQVCGSCGRPGEAVDAYLAALALRPDVLEAEALLHQQLMSLCDWKRLGQWLDRLRERATHLPAATWTRGLDPWIALHLPIDPSLRAAAAREHARRVAGRASAMARPRAYAARKEGRLRIAYLSADFYDHATAHLATGVFERHDRDRFDVTGYAIGRNDGSPWRTRLGSAFERFVDLGDAGAAEIAARVARDGIDILVDLKGYTQESRMEAFALRPAPVQVHYLGFPGSLHAPFIDYLVADASVAPEPRGAEFGEAVVRLPGSYQANDDRQPLPGDAPARAACGLPEQGLVFCCFNRPLKFEPGVVRAWMRTLAAAPGSVLWLLEPGAAAKSALAREARLAGVDERRLVYAARTDRARNIARLQLADLLLDTWTCNAHTTASDALWAGVPVLSAPTASFAGRVGASLLRASALPEFVASGPEDYEARALALARDPAKLRQASRHLRENRLSLPLFQTGAFTRRLEQAYAEMWRRHCSGTKPEAFDVA